MAMNTTTQAAPSSSSTTSAPGRDRIAESLRHMVDEADQLLKSAASAGDQKFDEARGRIEHQLHDLRLQLEDLEATALHRARRAARSADQVVHNHPYGAMGIAAAVGLLVGVLVARR
jgi:ElaB/YqjD/DUF883 family membrane-anchored ribosome-binding protein